MANKLLIILLIILLPFAICGQNKTRSTISKVNTMPAGVNSTVRFSPEREGRLNRRNQAYRSLVVLKNNGQLLPLGRLDTIRALVVSVGMGEENQLPQLAARYFKSDYRTVNSLAEFEKFNQNNFVSNNYNLVILAFGDKRRVIEKMVIRNGFKPGKNETTPSLIGERYVVNIPAKTKIMVIRFGSPSIQEVNSISDRADAQIVAENQGFDCLDLSVQLIFGAIGTAGRLSYDFDKFKKGDGISFIPAGRLRYVIPEEVGIDSIRLFQKVDSLVGIGLKARAFPGCQVLLAKKGRIFYQKSYGYQTYDQSRPVKMDDLFDLASVTKILAPLPALMMLADQKKFQVDKKMSDYWTNWKGSNKEGILVSDLLSHQARLKPGILLWPLVIDGQGHYITEYCSSTQKPGFNLRVSGNLFLLDNFRDQVYSIIRDSPLLKSRKYVYSDLGFVILPGVVEKLTGENYEKYLQERLYARLGASTLMYNPYLHVPAEKIVPTENDKTFRHELIQGFVHDETAAVMGGVSGNAGLFGSAGDVAKIMQLYLQEGEYGKERFISSGTLLDWTSSHRQKTVNRRGYGFDKPGTTYSRYKGKVKYPSASVSEESFGHSGYTGTFTWVDPANGMLFVFLSNRVFPDRNNHKINKLNLRQQILESAFKLAGNLPLDDH
jgi:CubicO group peptidase (beta-lactamase class C family)